MKNIRPASLLLLALCLCLFIAGIAQHNDEDGCPATPDHKPPGQNDPHNHDHSSEGNMEEYEEEEYDPSDDLNDAADDQAGRFTHETSGHNDNGSSDDNTHAEADANAHDSNEEGKGGGEKDVEDNVLAHSPIGYEGFASDGDGLTDSSGDTEQEHEAEWKHLLRGETYMGDSIALPSQHVFLLNRPHHSDTSHMMGEEHGDHQADLTPEQIKQDEEEDEVYHALYNAFRFVKEVVIMVASMTHKDAPTGWMHLGEYEYPMPAGQGGSICGCCV